MTDQRPAGPGQCGFDPATAIPDLEIIVVAEPDLDSGRLAREAFAKRLHIGFLGGPDAQESIVPPLPRSLESGLFGGVENVARRLERRRDRLDIDTDAIVGYGGGDDIVAPGEREMEGGRRRDDARRAFRVVAEDDVVFRATRAPGDEPARERGARGREVVRRLLEARDKDVHATAGIVERQGERFDLGPPAAANSHAEGGLACWRASGEDRTMETRETVEAGSARTEPHVSRAGMWRGAVESLPFQPGALIFGLAVGAAASQTGLTFGEAIGQSAIVYAGASQMLTLQIWTPDWTLGALLAAIGVTAAINARFMLMSATFRPWIEGLDRRLVYFSLLFLTDASFAIGARHHAAGGRDHGPVIGANIPLYLGWVATTAIGFLAGALVARPERYGLDLVLPIVFATLTVPMIRRARRYAPLVIAGLVAIIVSQFAAGWFIVAGALAGALSAALIDEAE